MKTNGSPIARPNVLGGGRLLGDLSIGVGVGSLVNTIVGPGNWFRAPLSETLSEVMKKRSVWFVTRDSSPSSRSVWFSSQAGEGCYDELLTTE